MRYPALTITLSIALATLLLGFIAGRVWAGAAVGAATPGPTGLATNETEGAGTPAAQTPPAECVPAPTATVAPPTATPSPVPPVASGQPLPYGEDWTVTVLGASTAKVVTKVAHTTEATGTFILIDLVVTNDQLDRRRFPYADFVLLDATGRTYDPSVEGTTVAGAGWQRDMLPSLPTDTRIVFDVAKDAGERFVLQSRTDPSFRVQIELVQHG